MRYAILASLLALSVNAQNVQLKLLASGLDLPTGIVNAGDSRLFVVQQRGTIVIWDGTRILPTPFLDVRSIVSCCDERGLLGLAFHPQFKQNKTFFIFYTATTGDITIARYTVSSNPDVADAASRTVIMTISHRVNANHNGGQMQFGRDGFLYFGTGDGGGAGDTPNNAQNLTVFLGKILRIDVNAATYAIPPSNPFHTEVWAYGLRNPWRFSFDRATGDLWIADVGQNRYEEINLQPATSIGGENYGWRLMEATHCFNPTTGCTNNATLKQPIIEYSHDDGSCSITGGYRYRGIFPRLQGTYFYADYCSGVIWGAKQNTNGSWSSTKLLTTTKKITSFGEDLNGELYLVDQGAGALFQVIDQLPPRRRSVSSR
jgi:glucose/arabinose dehydrogenase